jgi:uncharacterized protein YhaN
MNIETDLRNEIKKAESKFAEYHSAHEGYAIIAEKLDELWDEVRKHDHNHLRMYKEAIQVAYTSIRFCKMIKKNYKGVLPES